MDTSALIKKVKEFNDARNWDDKILPEDISKSIVIEASELLEHFQWDASRRNRGTEKPKDINAIGEEAADVFIYLARLCYIMDLDLEEIVLKKLKKNGDTKYPLKK